MNKAVKRHKFSVIKWKIIIIEISNLMRYLDYLKVRILTLTFLKKIQQNLKISKVYIKTKKNLFNKKEEFLPQFRSKEDLNGFNEIPQNLL